MHEGGFIILYRQIQDNWIWQDHEKAYAWIDLLMMANHQDAKIEYKGEVITLKRGTVNRSISSLALRWGWSRDRVKRFLSALESDDMVRVNATTNKTTITIVNYGLYQDVRSTNKSTNRQRASQRADSEQVTNNNDNNDNKDKQYTAPRKESYFERRERFERELEEWANRDD